MTASSNSKDYAKVNRSNLSLGKFPYHHHEYEAQETQKNFGVGYGRE